jgi:hypothetical protein
MPPMPPIPPEPLPPLKPAEGELEGASVAVMPQPLLCLEREQEGIGG